MPVPTITVESDANGAPHADGSAYANNFSGTCTHQIIAGSIWHNLPQEAPHPFDDTVIEVDSY